MAKLGYAAAIAVGVVLMYALDPDRGRRRRAQMRDASRHLVRSSIRLAEKRIDDVSNRFQGWTARHQTVTRPADDAVLVSRVRTMLGHVTAHPHALHVTAKCGIVELDGPILAGDAEQVLARTRRVPGVGRVIDHLDRRASADTPLLRGARRRSSRGGVTVNKTVVIHAPKSRVFEAFTAFERRDNIVTHVVANDTVEWTSVRPTIRNRGRARFQELPDGTRVTIELSYAPPFGEFGHTVARIFHVDPKHELDEDMMRFKTRLEKSISVEPRVAS
jgi:hypothetical protein